MVLGNLIQINARGEQERLLYGNPQMTYFKKVYPSCSNFARSYLNVPYSGTSAFGSKVNIKLPHNGDLLSNIYISVELPKIDIISGAANSSETYYCNGIGYKLIKNIQLKFNGKLIENLDSDMISHIYNYQFTNYDKDSIDKIFCYKNTLNNNINRNGPSDENTYNNLERNGPLNLNIPIPFFFTKTFDVNLPLCAMSNTEIEIIIEFERLENLIFKLPSTVPSNFTKLSILSEVINLDNREKKLFLTSDLDYLIEINTKISEELINGNTTGTITYDINAKNATNMLYFSFLPNLNERLRNYFNYSIAYLNNYGLPGASLPADLDSIFKNAYAPHLFKSNSNKIVENLIIQLDNNKLYENNTIDLPFLINNTSLACNLNKTKYQLGVYNFNLDRTKYLSGSLNFSRLIKKSISFEIGSDFKTYLSNIVSSSIYDDYKSIKFKCYSCYYNNLIIKDGLAGLKYN